MSTTTTTTITTTGTALAAPAPPSIAHILDYLRTPEGAALAKGLSEHFLNTLRDDIWLIGQQTIEAIASVKSRNDGVVFAFIEHLLNGAMAHLRAADSVVNTMIRAKNKQP
jgi:hypothetical protein